MLNKSKIGEPEKTPPIKCEHCGFEYCKEDDFYNWESVDEVGACLLCYEKHQEQEAIINKVREGQC